MSKTNMYNANHIVAVVLACLYICTISVYAQTPSVAGPALQLCAGNANPKFLIAMADFKCQSTIQARLEAQLPSSASVVVFDARSGTPTLEYMLVCKHLSAKAFA
jgi:Flp pilus assembly protein TadB